MGGWFLQLVKMAEMLLVELLMDGEWRVISERPVDKKAFVSPAYDF